MRDVIIFAISLALQRLRANQIATSDLKTALNRQNLEGQSAMCRHDVGYKVMHAVTIATVDDHVVLVVLVGDQFLGQRDHDETNAIVRIHVVRGHDMHTILAGSQDTKVVVDLDTGDLGVIREDPLDAVLQEANQLRIAHRDNHDVRSLQLLLQLIQNALEVFTRITSPIAHVVSVSVIREQVESTFNNQALITVRANTSGLLHVKAVPQERTDLKVLELSQRTTHILHVVSDHVDLLQSQSISSFLDRDRSIEARTRFRHHVLDLLHTTNDVQRTLIETVGSGATHPHALDAVVVRENSYSASNEVNITNDGADNSLLVVRIQVTNLTIDPVMSGNIGADVAGDFLQGAAVASFAHVHLHLDHADVASQSLRTILNNQTRNVVGGQEIDVFQGQSNLLALVNLQTSGLVGQLLHLLLVVEDVGDLILSTSLRLNVALLIRQIDNGACRNLGHQDVLEHAGNPLLLQEERAVSNDRGIALRHGLKSHRILTVLKQLIELIGVVVVEGSAAQLGAGQVRISGHALHQYTVEFLTSRTAAQDVLEVTTTKVDTIRRIGLKYAANFIFKSQIGIGLHVVSDNLRLGTFVQTIHIF